MTALGLAHLTYALSDRVAIVTLNRPEVRNALNARAYADLEAFATSKATPRFARWC